MEKLFDISITEITDTQNAGAEHFQQTLFWGEFKARHGWTLKRFNISWIFKGELPEELDEGNVTNPNGQTGDGDNSGSSNRQFDATNKTVTLNSVSGSYSDTVSVMIRSFGKGLFSMAYVPLYPTFPFPIEKVTAQNQTVEFAALLNEIGLALKSYLPKNTICVRFDPDVEFDSPEKRDEFNLGMKLVSYADRLKVRKTKVDIQPPDSTQIDLTASEEEILARMKNKWRYNIRLAEKKGVEIEKVDGKSLGLSEKSNTNNVRLSTKLDVFYDLYKVTSERDGISIHPKSYYGDLITLSANWNGKTELPSDNLVSENGNIDGKCVANPVVALYIAKHENDYLGAIITLFTKSESIYLYGCSSNVKRNLMPNFLLQWTAMKDAKSFGSKYYDMYGMSPTDDEKHPMHGLYLFKTGFGGKNIHRTGSWDVRLSPMYKIATAAENARAWYHKVFKKKIRGR